ncbi:hypothetical protein [Streptomyces sp. NPDC002185]|uniref:hypothetical protein n=1 Tax=Streptomyces sp. NPDC002185 TaxID=3364636 RepID=UPI0036CDB3D7
MSSRSPDDPLPGVSRYAAGAPAAEGPGDPHELLRRARRLTAEGHPSAGGAWERASTALRRAGHPLAPGDHADALDATALDCRGRARPAAGPLFSRAAGLHERAGRRGKALVSRARALLSEPEPGATVCAGLAALGERARVLHTTGQATAAETATVLLLRCRARADLLDTGPDPAAEATALRRDLTRLIAFVTPHRADPAVLRVLAEARTLLGRVTVPDDPAAALVRLRAAVTDHRTGGRPWQAAESELLLAGVLRATGAPQEAARVLRAAAPLPGADRARQCLALARTLALSGGEPDGDTETALLAEAVRHADGVTGDSRLSTLARLALGIAQAERGRWRAASAVLEEALSGLSGDGDDDETARVRARAWLAYCALCLGEPGRAAGDFAYAEAEARRWDDRHHGAALSHLTAYALCAAGAPEKAARAYERAADLWRSAGDHAAAAHSLQSRARRVREVWGADAADVVEEEALREAARGLPGDGEPDRARASLRSLPEPYGPPGPYQVDVYGEVGGTGTGRGGRYGPEERGAARARGCA